MLEYLGKKQNHKTTEIFVVTKYLKSANHLYSYFFKECESQRYNLACVKKHI